MEARACLDLDGETFLEHYVHSLWAAGRILIVNNEPEAPALSAEIIAAFGFVDMLDFRPRPQSPVVCTAAHS